MNINSFIDAQNAAAIKKKEEYINDIQREIWQLQCQVSEFESILKNMDFTEENNGGLHM